MIPVNQSKYLVFLKTVELGSITRAAEALGAQVTELEQMAEHRHIFTHVEWQMRGYYLRCSGGADLFWVPPARLTEAYALPTAFRQFLDAESD